VEPSGPPQACNGIALPFTYNLRVTIMDFCHTVTVSVSTEGNSSMFYEPVFHSRHACLCCGFLPRRTGSVLSLEKVVTYFRRTDCWTVASFVGM